MFPRAIPCLFAVVAFLCVAPVPRACGDEADDQYNVAAGHYAAKRWDLAAEEFGSFVARFPSHPRADQSVFFMAEALLQNHRAEEAAKQYAEYLRRSPDGPYAPMTRFRLAEADYLAGRLDQARRGLEEFRAGHPDDPQGVFALPYLGEIALAQGDFAAAADHFREAIVKFPASGMRDDYRLGLARALERSGERDEALSLYQKIAAEGLGALSAEARFRFGAMQYAAGSYGEAGATLLPLDKDAAAGEWRLRGRLLRALALRRLKRYDEAAILLASIPADSELAVQSQFWLAMARQDQRQWDAAADILLALAQQHPNHPWTAAIRYHAGHALLCAGKPAEATQEFDLALDVDRGDNRFLDDAALGKIQAAAAQKDYASVDRQAQQFLKQYPDSLLVAEVRRLWGASLVELGRSDAAVEPLEAFLATHPSGDAALKATAQLAVSHARLGKWDEAKAALDKLLAQDVSHPVIAPTIENLAEAAYDTSNWARAAELFTWLVERSGRKEYVDRGMSGLGWVQLKQGQLDQAAATFDRLIERQPETELLGRTIWARGYALEKLDRFDEAMASYRKVINESPRSPQRPQVMLAAARLHRRMEQHDQAVAMYQRLTTEYPNDAGLDTTLFEWGRMLADLQRLDEADSLMRRLRGELPGSRHWADATYYLAKRAEAAGNREEARRLVDQALAAKDVSGSSQQNLLALRCRLDAAEERWEDLARSAQQLLDKNPKDTLRRVAESWMAESLYHRADYKAAAARLDRLLRTPAADKEAWMAVIPLRRAEIFALEKNWTEAEKLASRIERDFPEYDGQYEADYLLGRSLAAQGRFDEARGAYQKVIASKRGAKTETAAMAQWMIGETYFHQKDHAAAVREYLRVEILYDYPRWQAAALVEAAKCYEQLGRAGEAAKLYRRIVDKYPNTAFVDEAKRCLTAASTPVNSTEAQRPASISPLRK
jgi:cellulose synthase operon protein C